MRFVQWFGIVALRIVNHGIHRGRRGRGRTRPSHEQIPEQDSLGVAKAIDHLGKVPISDLRERLSGFVEKGEHRPLADPAAATGGLGGDWGHEPPGRHAGKAAAPALRTARRERERLDTTVPSVALSLERAEEAAASMT